MDMNLKLENIGKIKTADIDLDGITVIAGENNTGKSTVGKMLFCLFNSFYKIEEQIIKEREVTINRVLDNYEDEMFFQQTLWFNARELRSNIVKNRELLAKDTKLILNEIEGFYLQEGLLSEDVSQESLERLSNKICEYLNIEDEKIIRGILKKRLASEFGMKIGHLNVHDEESRVCLKIKKDKIEFSVKNNEDINIESYISLIKEVIYIDDPFVLDNLNSRIPYSFFNKLEHRNDLLIKLGSTVKKEGFSVIDEVVINKKLENVFDAMKEVCDGELKNFGDSKKFVYKTDKLNGDLEIANLSTGIKSFVILRTLLQNGNVDENGVVILDEPEVHLHPEWQLKYAEIIVLIQKEFNVNILLNTHSPYFLNAIQVFSGKHSISDKCKYYMTKENDNGNRIIIEDVTDNIEKIYEKMARPLQELENLEYRDEYTK